MSPAAQPAGQHAHRPRGPGTRRDRKRARRQGLASFKLKVDEDVELALARVRTIREWVGDRIKLRVDAAGLWDRAHSFVVRSRDLASNTSSSPCRPTTSRSSLPCAVRPSFPSPSTRAYAAPRRRPGRIASGCRHRRHQAHGPGRLAAHPAGGATGAEHGSRGGLRPSSTVPWPRAGRLHGRRPRLQRPRPGLATGALLENDLTDRPMRTKAGMLSFADDPGLGIGALLPDIVK